MNYKKALEILNFEFMPTEEILNKRYNELNKNNNYSSSCNVVNNNLKIIDEAYYYLKKRIELSNKYNGNKYNEDYPLKKDNAQKKFLDYFFDTYLSKTHNQILLAVSLGLVLNNSLNEKIDLENKLEGDTLKLYYSYNEFIDQKSDDFNNYDFFKRPYTSSKEIIAKFEGPVYDVSPYDGLYYCTVNNVQYSANSLNELASKVGITSNEFTHTGVLTADKTRYIITSGYTYFCTVDGITYESPTLEDLSRQSGISVIELAYLEAEFDGYIRYFNLTTNANIVIEDLRYNNTPEELVNYFGNQNSLANDIIPDKSYFNMFDIFPLIDDYVFAPELAAEGYGFCFESVPLNENVILTYTIKDGDSKNSILLDYGVTELDLYTNFNCTNNVNQLRVDDIIYISKNTYYTIGGTFGDRFNAYSITELSNGSGISIHDLLDGCYFPIKYAERNR